MLIIMWKWLKKGTLKKEIMSLQLAAKNQGLRTNAIKARMDKNQKDSKC